jgi:parallel beta-helix repeat protein
MAAGGSTRRTNSSWAVPQEPPRRKGTPDSVLRLVEWGLMGVVVLSLVVLVGLPAWTDAAAPAPSLSVSPTSGTVGTLVTVSGSNFGHTTVQLTWDGSAAGMPSVTVVGNGSFRTTFKVQSGTTGQHQVQATSTSATTLSLSVGNGNGNGKKSTSPSASAVFVLAEAVAATPAPSPTAAPVPSATVAPTTAPTATPASTVAPLPTASPSPVPSLPTSCTGLQTLIDGAAAGATITVPSCLYREQAVIAKPLTLLAQAGTEVRGSDLWTSWSGNISTQTVPYFGNGGVCSPGTSRCTLPEQVFIDGVAQFQLATGSAPGAGQFALDSTRHVVLGSTPAGHVVEVSVRDHWVVVTASDVTISGFHMKHAASRTQVGAINASSVDRLTVSDNVLSDSHGAIITLSHGTGHRVVRNDIARGGQEGMTAYAVVSTLVQGNAIHDNNTEDFDPGWEAGGLKSCTSNGLTMDANVVYNNKGPGLWLDCAATNGVFSNNVVHHNSGNGIFFEVSTGAKIYGNRLYENGWGVIGSGSADSRFTAGGWGAAILISSSGGAEVYNNSLAWNADGISVASQNRADRQPTTNIYVHDNVIIEAPQPSDASEKVMLGWGQDYAGALFDPASNNHGALNRYWHSLPEPSWCRVAWSGCVDNLPTFNATLGEESGRYLTSTERDAVLTANGLPLAPTAR